MTQEEIQERNKEIALMLGLKLPFSISEYSALICKNNGNYHSDWNWIMKAIQFLQNHFESKEMVWTAIERYPLFTDIETVFTMVSDFAKHYNEGKL
jgi:D-mannonate dehydratase